MPVDALAAPHALISQSLIEGILPVGITPRTVTTGPWTLPDGTVATGRATITCPVNLVHTPTGQPIASGDMSVRLVNGMASWDLCPTDQAGLTQTGWTYTLQVELNGALSQPKPIPFVLLSAGPATVDLDKLVPVVSSTGQTISAAVVTSVNGSTGDVVINGSGMTTAQLDAAIAALLTDTTSATYAKVVALITARTGFGAGS